MLACDDPRAFFELLPGFLPTTPAGRGGRSGGRLKSAHCSDLGRALLGDGPYLWDDFEAPSIFAGDFWESWYLAADAGRSQYDLLREVITVDKGLPGQVVCLALRGTGFHGQDNRDWAAVEGNLHLTLGLKCDLPAIEGGAALTMLPAVAVMDALSRLGLSKTGTADPGIKWVNDILVAGGKAGGVLTSARSQDGRLLSAVLGIGLNVCAVPEVPPSIFTPRVTSLDDHISLGANGFGEAVAAVLRAVAARFRQLSSGDFEGLLTAYRASSAVMGREVAVHPATGREGTVRRGRVLEIRPDLTLVLSDGPEPITGGRLALENTPS